jgi:hypothetical protein
LGPPAPRWCNRRDFTTQADTPAPGTTTVTATVTGTATSKLFVNIKVTQP